MGKRNNLPDCEHRMGSFAPVTGICSKVGGRTLLFFGSLWAMLGANPVGIYLSNEICSCASDPRRITDILISPSSKL
jgi:hypothetical protein